MKSTSKVNMNFLSITIFALCLNLGGAIFAKYTSISLDKGGPWFFWLGMLFLVFAIRFKFWIWVGKLYQLSYIYPFMSLSYLVSLAAGYFFFDEKILISKIMGSLIIVFGVFVVSNSNYKE